MRRRTARRLRIGFASLGGAVALVVLVAGVLVLTIDPNAQKMRVIDAVRRATGRELTIAGPVHLTLGLNPGVEAQGVSFANRAGGSRPQMATADGVEAQIALLPLLLGRIEIASITLQHPDILLETDAQGVGNWEVQRPIPTSAAGPAAPHVAREPIAIESIRIENARLTWRDGRTGWTEIADLPRARVDADEDSTNVVADAVVAAAAIHLRANLGPPARLMGAEAGSFPVKVALNLADATLALSGMAELPWAVHGFGGRVEAAVPDLAALGPVLQQSELPPLHDVRVDATVAGPVVQAATVHVGASDLDRYLAGAALNQLDVTYTGAAQPARFVAEGTLAASPWRLEAGVLRAGQGIALRGLSLQSSMADAKGDLAAALTPRPTLRGTLVSDHIDLDELRTLTRRPPPVGVAAPAAEPATAVAPAPAALFSKAPLPWDVLRRADADLQMTVGLLQAARADFHAASGHIVLHDGSLRLMPFSVQAPEGQVDGSLTADASLASPPVAIQLRSAAFSLDAVAKAFGLPGGSDAPVELDVALQSMGQSPHDLAAHLDGHAGLALVDGEIANATLTALLGSVLKQAGAGLEPEGRSHVRCLAIRLDASKGQVSLAALKLDTARLLLEGGGNVDLGAETLALRLRPTVRIGGAGVVAPVRVDGPITHPAAGLDSPGQAGRPGIVIGGLGAAQDSCTAELTAARDGRAGRLPADAAVKAAKPADILRSFLR